LAERRVFWCVAGIFLLGEAPMFIDTQLSRILLPVLLALVVIAFASHLDARRQTDPLRRAWVLFRFNTIAIGAVLLLLLFCLPSTPALSTFGYPSGVQAVTQPQLLLNTLQEYNRALVRTTEVVFWLLFLFVWWFLTSLYAFSKTVNAIAGKNKSAE
jgi:ABC-type xylose transport system permease subunit